MHALRGLRYALLNDLSVRLDVLVGVFLAIFGTVVHTFMNPLGTTELLFLVLSWVLLFITELQNTALETALDRLHPDIHADIGRSKDIQAATVVMALFFIAVVVVAILIPRM